MEYTLCFSARVSISNLPVDIVKPNNIAARVLLLNNVCKHQLEPLLFDAQWQQRRVLQQEWV